MSNWSHFAASVIRYPELAFSIDFSKIDLNADFIAAMQPKIDKAFEDMQKLEAGAIANPDEGRMVGHYWLRKPELAPTAELKEQIVSPLQALKSFATQVHGGQLAPPSGGRFRHILVIGIGGSALGPQLVSAALGRDPRMSIHFLDNTDPTGIDTVLGGLGAEHLPHTLALVISKSGGTPETRNGMLEAKAAYEDADLDFAAHAVAITGDGSKLDAVALSEGWLARFPMQDWIGGRTSVMSTVGLVPAALQGINVDSFLEGAAIMDERTRVANGKINAAMQLALAWYRAGNGKGEKDMVVLPYKDSLVLFSKYLQQLVMESIGKEKDLDGNTVHQGIAVYGNKGSTDQHAYVQQLRDGVPNFFATFIEVRKGRSGESIEVDPGVTSADYLQGFLRGTRRALFENGRESVTLSIHEVTPQSLGALIGLFERAVSFYASLVNVNAYHQPGVEAGKKAAATFLEILNKVRGRLTGYQKTAEELAFEANGDIEDVYHCLTHLAANGEANISLGKTPAEDTFQL